MRQKEVLTHGHRDTAGMGCGVTVCDPSRRLGSTGGSGNREAMSCDRGVGFLVRSSRICGSASWHVLDWLCRGPTGAISRRPHGTCVECHRICPRGWWPLRHRARPHVPDPVSREAGPGASLVTVITSSTARACQPRRPEVLQDRGGHGTY